MSDRPEQTPEKAGPVIGSEAHEVQAVFASDATLQDAMTRLERGGFDRADLSLPYAHPATSEATPEQGADQPVTDTDMQQTRTLGTSMAGTVGAFAAAAATVATGGAAAVVIGAAAAAGAGAAALAHSAGQAAESAQHDDREAAAQRGELVLAVRATTDERRSRAEDLLRQAGATRVEVVNRTSADVGSGVDSSAWTG